jgi:hypothetical protein
MRFPDDSLAKLFLKESLACDKLKDAVVAVELLFTTIGICYPSLDVKYLQFWFIARIKIEYLR